MLNRCNNNVNRAAFCPTVFLSSPVNPALHCSYLCRKTYPCIMTLLVCTFQVRIVSGTMFLSNDIIPEMRSAKRNFYKNKTKDFCLYLYVAQHSCSGSSAYPSRC